MNRSEVLFTTIDVLFHPFQNYINVPDVVWEKDIPYSDEFPENVMDFQYKKSDKPLPVLINIHGGGFVKGDKKHRKSIGMLYADKGWFVININYRLAPKYPFPSHIEDAFKLLTLLPKLADKYNLDLSRLVLTGDSSGAYTAAEIEACLVSRELRENLGLPEVKNIVPTGLLLFCGVYDPSKVAKMPCHFTENIASSITGIKLKNMEDIYEYKYIKELAPINYVSDKWCPVCMTYAEKDVFCKGQGEALYQKLVAAGVPVFETHSTSLIDNHCYHFNFWTKTSKNTMKFVYEYLEKIKNCEL